MAPQQTLTMPHHRLSVESDSTRSAQQLPPKHMSEVNTNTMDKRGSRSGRGQGRNTGQQRNNRFKLKSHQVYHQNQQLLENMFTNQYYKKYFTIQASSGENLSEIDVIKANKQMEGILKGKPKKVTELRNGTLFVEVSNKDQSNNIRSMKKQDNTNIIVEEHQKLN